MSKVAVVIPIYKEELDDLEKISLAQVRKVLGHYPIIFVAPDNKNFSYIKPDDMIIQFHPYFFQSLKTYNQLLLHPFFYELFLNFDYILLYQLDAFVFYDALEDFCRLGYDYIGAPWPYYGWNGKKVADKTPRVGNGGFSLRKVKACHELLKGSNEKTFEGVQEDGLFATYGTLKSIDFNVAPVEVANLFAMEWYPDRHIKKLRGKLPFGCHGWTKFSADFYVEFFARFGYDLRPFRNQMKTDDYNFYYPFNLKKIALTRLIRRIDHGQSIFKCLPTKNFASVRLVKSFGAMKIASRLLAEENSLIDKVFLYDKKNLQNFILDLTRETLPHLIIAVNHDDESLIAEIEDKGLVYGEHFILFQHEYMKFQKNFLHSLVRSVDNGN